MRLTVRAASDEWRGGSDSWSDSEVQACGQRHGQRLCSKLSARGSSLEPERQLPRSAAHGASRRHYREGVAQDTRRRLDRKGPRRLRARPG